MTEIERLKHRLSIVEAHERGEKIEYRNIGSDLPWHPSYPDDWYWDNYVYRVKPDPEQVRRDAVEEAYARGEKIEYCRWEDHPSPNWQWGDFDYRVKGK